MVMTIVTSIVIAIVITIVITIDFLWMKTQIFIMDEQGWHDSLPT